jgi:hypothetical protein
MQGGARGRIVSKSHCTKRSRFFGRPRLHAVGSTNPRHCLTEQPLRVLRVQPLSRMSRQADEQPHGPHPLRKQAVLRCVCCRLRGTNARTGPSTAKPPTSPAGPPAAGTIHGEGQGRCVKGGGVWVPDLAMPDLVMLWKMAGLAPPPGAGGGLGLRAQGPGLWRTPPAIWGPLPFRSTTGEWRVLK